nr:dihydrodipicolinate synthase family protein [Thermaerobacter sp.]
MTSLTGVIPIALTPFDPDGAVDHASIAQLTAFYRRSGASAITILGIMGEAAKLSDREREA